MKEYIVLYETGRDPGEMLRDLMRKVSSKMEEGFIPIGGPKITNGNNIIAYQAMIKS